MAPLERFRLFRLFRFRELAGFVEAGGRGGSCDREREKAGGPPTTECDSYEHVEKKTNHHLLPATKQETASRPAVRSDWLAVGADKSERLRERRWDSAFNRQLREEPSCSQQSFTALMGIESHTLRPGHLLLRRREEQQRLRRNTDDSHFRRTTRAHHSRKGVAAVVLVLLSLTSVALTHEDDWKEELRTTNTLEATQPSTAPSAKPAPVHTHRALSGSAEPTTTASLIPYCLADDNAAAEALSGLDCQGMDAAGYCDAYLCWDCVYAGVCDTTCDFCCDDRHLKDTTCASFPGLLQDALLCPALASRGYCETRFCSSCGEWAGACDLSCGFCPVGSPVTMAPTVDQTTQSSPSPTTGASVADGCVDFDAEVSESSGGLDCVTLATMGYCASEFCPTCSSSGYCDAACGYCPTSAPTTAPCVNYDAEVSESSGGLDCVTLATMGYCASEFCPTCSSSGYCDAACGYCLTPAPTQAPCVNYDAEVRESSGGLDCATLATMGYCASEFCPTCGSSGYCDAACGYCSDSEPTTPPTNSPLPTVSVDPTPTPSTSIPTPKPTPLPTTSSPSATFSPTSSFAPTFTGIYDVSEFDELKDAIRTAIDGRPWILTVTEDISVDHSLFVMPYKNIQVIGSSTLGRRARITPGAENPPGFISCCANMDPAITSGMCAYIEYPKHNSHYYGKSNIWLENLDISGFSTIRRDRDGEPDEANAYAIRVGRESSFTLVNCRLADNQGYSLFVEGPDSSVFVAQSEFVDNRAVLTGAGIQIGDRENTENGNTVQVVDTIFARNIASQSGAAIYAVADSQLTIRNCAMFDNRVDDYGGAVSMRGDLVVTKTLTIQNSSFLNNSAGSYAGAVSTGSKIELYISNTLFAGNIALGSGGGAIRTSTDTDAVITGSVFERNYAPAGAGGALLTFETRLHLIGSNFTENSAALDGGAVRSEERTAVYPRGATRFQRNSAKGKGGAISLDASTLKTNEGRLTFTENVARLGGALSADNEVENERSILMSAGCQSVTFQMNWAASAALEYAEGTNSALVRRRKSYDCFDADNDANDRSGDACGGDGYAIHPDWCGKYDDSDFSSEEMCCGCGGGLTSETEDTDAAILPSEILDERGEWTILSPSGAEDSTATFCLAPGEYTIVGSEGAYCFEGFGGGFLQVVDLAGTELLSYFTLKPGDGCTSKTLLVDRRPGLGSVRTQPRDRNVFGVLRERLWGGSVCWRVLQCRA